MVTGSCLYFVLASMIPPPIAISTSPLLSSSIMFSFIALLFIHPIGTVEP